MAGPAKKVIFINSHPIQYFAPLYQYLNKNGLPTECWYCSDENVKGHFDKQFGTEVKWDIPLLEGYTARFFRNRSWKPSLYNGFFGLINPGLLSALWKAEASVVVVHGWNYFTHVAALVVARLRGHIVCIRGESPINQELLKSKFNRLMKKVLLDQMLFRLAHRILYIGTQNRDFYRYYGVSLKKLVFAPYAVDNERFRKAAASLSKMDARKSLGIPTDAYVILFAAKLTEKKRPLDLVKAYQQLSIKNKYLVIVGDGELKDVIKDSMNDIGMRGDGKLNFIMPGFVNQTGIVKYYLAADVFVLCSGIGETWGLSVNEAMNFNLPVVVSRTAGCAEDLVTPESGIAFDEGAVDQLASAITRCQEAVGRFASAQVVENYSYETIRKSLLSLNI